MPKREQILDAAATLFADKGFYAATVEEIASRAGIGKSTVYEYFSSKDHIFQETLKEGLESYMEAMKGRLKQPCSVRDVLTAIGTAHFNFIKERTHIARILADEYNSQSPWAMELLLQLRERRILMFASLISQGIELGEFRKMDPRTGAEVFLGVLGALCMPVLCRSGKSGTAVDAEAAEAEDVEATEAAKNTEAVEERFYHGIDIFFTGILS
ncbi:MAG: TetR/AcrR family transcriptional regulator [Syntrophaceticus schinkii]|jgi:AcrR family transcriptional regulator